MTALLISGAGTRAHAEFKPGVVVPAFSMKSTDGLPFSMAKRQGRVALVFGARNLKPKVLVLHLFQPDCLQCQAQMRALEALYEEYRKDGVLVVGVAYRGDVQQAQVVRRRLKVTYPILEGRGSPLADQFAAGDTLGITDIRGTVRFAQVGYGRGDEKVWQGSVRELLAGRPVTQTTIAHNRLAIGDRLPAIRLNSLLTGKPMELTGEGGHITFQDETGRVVHPKAAVGMFSRL
jgi:peroxiredoxin